MTEHPRAQCSVKYLKRTNDKFQRWPPPPGLLLPALGKEKQHFLILKVEGSNIKFPSRMCYSTFSGSWWHGKGFKYPVIDSRGGTLVAFETGYLTTQLHYYFSVYETMRYKQQAEFLPPVFPN